MSRFSIKNSQQSVHTQTSRTRRRATLSLAPNWGEIELEQRRLLATVTWDGGAGTWNWADRSNWSGDLVPTASDDVVIPDLAGTQTIQVNSSATVLSVNSAEALTIQSGNTFTVTAGNSTVSGAFTVASGSALKAMGNASFNAFGTTTIDGASLYALSGGKLLMINAINYNATSGTTIQATGANSRIDLSGLNLMTYAGPGDYQAKVEALSGGTVDLSNVANLSVTNLNSGNWQGLAVKADGQNSTIDLSKMTRFSDGYNYYYTSSLTASNNGTLLTPSLTTVQNVSFNHQGGDINVSNLTSIQGGGINVSQGNIAYPALVNFTSISVTSSSGSLELNNPSLTEMKNSSITYSGGNLSLSQLTNIDNTNIYVSNSKSLVLKQVTNYNATSGTTIQATGANSRIDLSGLNLMTYAGPGDYQAKVEALSGGTVDLSNVANLSVTNLNSGNWQGLAVKADGQNSTIDLSKMTRFSDGYNYYYTSSLTASNNGTLLTPSLTTVQNVSFNHQGGDINVSNLTSIQGGGINVSQGNIAYPALVNFTSISVTSSSGSLELNNPSLTEMKNSSITYSGGNLSLSQLTNIDNTNIYVSNSKSLVLKQVTNYNATSGTTIQATGANSRIDLSGLNLMTYAGPGDYQAKVEALSGGTVDLSNVANLSVTNLNSGNWQGLAVKADGQNSTIDLSKMTRFSDGYNYYYTSSLTASNNGTLLTPSLTTVQNVSFNHQGGDINVSNLTSIQGGGINVSQGNIAYPALVNFTSISVTSSSGSLELNNPSLTEMKNSSITYSGGNLSLSQLTNIDNTNIYVSNSKSLVLKQVTNYNATSGTTIQATGANSRIDLSGLNLMTYAGPGDYQAKVEALSGGTVDLSNVANLSVTNLNSGNWQGLAVKADGQNSTIDLSKMTRFSDGYNFYNLSSLSALNGCMLKIPTSALILSNVNVISNNATISGDLQLINGAGLYAGNGGKYVGNITNDGGVISPGSADGQIGILNIQGNYTQTSLGRTDITLNGTTPGTQYDQLIVTGTATLAGRLNVSAGFTPVVGNAFNILQAGNITGDFQVTSLPTLSGGVALTKSTGATGVTLNTIAAPVIAVADNYNSEGDAAVVGGPSQNMAFVISGSAPAGGATINYTTAGGNPGVDYTATSGSFTVPAGAYSRTVNVPIIGNQLLQADRTFQMQASATGVTPAFGTGLIYDDDAPVSLTLANSTAQATVYSAFSPSPAVTVKNINGHLVQGATVSFSAGTGADGSSASFAGGVPTATAVSNASGVATAPTLTANNKVGGPYTLTINSLDNGGSGVSTGTMLLSNQAAVASSIQVYSGSGQSATVHSAYAEPFKVKALDAGGNGVQGVTVIFSVPGTGASGSFAGGTVSAVTGADGVAISPVFTANNVAGSFSITASVTGLTSVNFSLTNMAGAAANLYYSSGGSQSTKINTGFGNPLKAYVTDTYGNPVAGTTVTWAAPATGASASFAGGINTAVSGVNGIATSATVTANSVAGFYAITASASGLSGSPGFSLNNAPEVASAVELVSGNNQSATVATNYSEVLKVRVIDSFGNAVPGVTVTFAAPGAGASGTFAGGTTSVTTDSAGIATSAVLQANTISGSFHVSATVAGLTPYSFSLTNLAGAAANLAVYSGNNQTALMTQGFASPLAVRVTDTYGNPVAGTAITFTAPGSGATAAFAGGLNTATSNANGLAVSAALTANKFGGAYIVTASAAGIASQSFSLTNLAPVVTSFTVQKGSVGRSFVRYVDLVFNTTATLGDIVASIGTANPRIRMANTGLDGSQNVNYNLAGKIAAIDAVLAMDFGLLGIGGDRNSANGDGSYLIEMDLDGNGSFETSRRFFRLLGDVNGDKVVDSLDANIVAANIGATGSNIAADINGDGVVNAADTLLVRRQKGRRITI